MGWTESVNVLEYLYFIIVKFYLVIIILISRYKKTRQEREKKNSSLARKENWSPIFISFSVPPLSLFSLLPQLPHQHKRYPKVISSRAWAGSCDWRWGRLSPSTPVSLEWENSSLIRRCTPMSGSEFEPFMSSENRMALRWEELPNWPLDVFSRKELDWDIFPEVISCSEHLRTDFSKLK
jgi:hypothetical protein